MGVIGMKDVSSVALLLALGSVICQGPLYGMGAVPGNFAGAQPTMYGPNYPQVQGVNVQGFGFNQPMGGGMPRTDREWSASAANPAIQQRINSTPNTAGPIFPQCSSLDSIGSPVLLIFQATEVINKLMDPKNANSFVNYIYFNSVADSTNPLFQIFTLIFALSDFGGTNYIGVRFKIAAPKVTDAHFTHAGIGDADFIAFIMNKDIAVVNAALDISGSTVPPNINCGDLKFIYSSYGNTPGTAVGGLFPGDNNNGGIAALIEQFKAKEASFSQRNSFVWDEIFKNCPISGATGGPFTYKCLGYEKYYHEARYSQANN